jgi:hypothetical protein
MLDHAARLHVRNIGSLSEGGKRLMSALGQKRRLVQWMAAPRLPRYAVSDQTRAALQYVAKGLSRHRSNQAATLVRLLSGRRGSSGGDRV